MCRAEEGLGTSLTPNPRGNPVTCSAACVSGAHAPLQPRRTSACAILESRGVGEAGQDSRASSHRCSEHGAGHRVTQGARWLRLAPTRPRASGLLSTAACLLPCHPPRHPLLVLPSWSPPLIPTSEPSIPAAGGRARESSLVAAAPGRARAVPLWFPACSWLSSCSVFGRCPGIPPRCCAALGCKAVDRVT